MVFLILWVSLFIRTDSVMVPSLDSPVVNSSLPSPLHNVTRPPTLSSDRLLPLLCYFSVTIEVVYQVLTMIQEV